jgi:hypothetical protein
MLLQLITRVVAATDDELAVNQLQSQGSIADLIGQVTPWISLAAGVIAFFYLIFSGFVYLTAGGNAESAKKGQQGILNAVIGLVIIALAYAIVTAIIKSLGSATVGGIQ